MRPQTDSVVLFFFSIARWAEFKAEMAAPEKAKLSTQTQKVLGGGGEGKTGRKPDGQVLDGLHFHFPLSSQSKTADKKQQLPMGDPTVMLPFSFLFLRKDVFDAQGLSGCVFF